MKSTGEDWNRAIFRVLLVAGVMWLSARCFADEPVVFAPEPTRVEQQPCAKGWREWGHPGDFKGLVARQERIRALTRGTSGDIWVGTNHGRLLSMKDEKWTLQAHLTRTQITGIALENPNKIWLSTSAGVRRLDQDKGKWKLTDFRTYYQGHPMFVSGGYIPGEDAERLWGYVDGIYVPPKNHTYAPLVISTAHGLFCWGGYGGVWHHYMPHYWGANSPWLDTRTLVPHRRPRRIVEDADLNLWIGTESDGMIRLNAAGRGYHAREPEKNQKDGSEFTFLHGDDVGREFDTVVDLAVGVERGIWAVLEFDGKTFIARFDGRAWSTMDLSQKRGRANCVAEITPGTVFVGVSGYHPASAIIEVDWASRRIENITGPAFAVHKIERMADGRIFAASPLVLYEKTLDP